jgi:4-hydroxybenzoate polyprenyltransferase
MNDTGKFRALLATARLPNLPSVMSNVWFGVALGAWQWGWDSDRVLLLKGAVLVLCGVLLYLGGNFLNDWHDCEWDREKRPERALPRGLFSPLSYQLRAIRFLGLAIIIAYFINVRCSITAAVIAGCVVIYTRWHKKAVWAVIPMGLCRALLIVMGFLAVDRQIIKSEPIYSMRLVGTPVVIPTFWQEHDYLAVVALHAAGLFLWITGLSLHARYESMPNPPTGPRTLAKILLCLPVLCMAAWWVRLYPYPTLLGALPLLATLVMVWVKKQPIPVMVAALLAAIPLVECVAAFPLALSLLAQVDPGGKISHQPVPALTLALPGIAYMLGRRLQRWVPAT